MEAPPPGYSPITLDMLRRVDEVISYQLTRLCRGGIRTNPSGGLPADSSVATAIDPPRAKLLLQPLPGGPGRQKAEAEEPAFKKPRNEVAAKGPGKGKATGSKNRDDHRLAANVKKAFGSKEPPCPKELLGHNTATPEGTACASTITSRRETRRVRANSAA